MTKKKQVGVRFDSNRTRLKTGETQRPNGTYAYRWSTPDGKRHSIYAPTLEKLREQEEQIIVDKHDGIRSGVKSITVNKSFAKYISEFNDIPEHLKDKRIDEVDRTPAENLAYQVGWTTLVIKWESDERKGIPVKTPSDNFKWNQLGELYQWFTDTYAQLSLQELKDRLNENINSIYAMIDSLSEEELFKPHMRKWADEATKTAVWEVYKFIHVNTVAPFGTFRTKIRKWKKIAL